MRRQHAGARSIAQNHRSKPAGLAGSNGAMSGSNAMAGAPDVLALALERHQAGQGEEAGQLYRQALDADPTNPTALYLYGLLNFEAGQSETAAVLLESVVALRPEHAQARLTLAQLRHWRGEHADAIADYRRTVALTPDSAEAVVGLANALREAGDVAQAVVEGEAAAAHFPHFADAWIALGAARLARGDSAGAADAYERAITLDPDRAQARTGLATALLAAERQDAAAVAAAAAMAADPSSSEACFVRGAALRALWRTDEAIAALEQAAVLDPSRAAVHLDLGALYAERGAAAAAEASLKTAVLLDPALAAAHASLGSVYLRAGRQGEAEKHTRAALALDSDIVAAHQTLASLLAAQGWSAEAKRHRDRAYAGRNLFIERAPGSELTVLMPITAEAGNTPLRDLMPRSQVSRLRWVIEYADAAQIDALPPCDVVFNAIGDVDLAAPTAAPMRRFLSRCARPVLNPPAKVAGARRDRLPALLAGLPGVVTPRARRLSATVIARHGLANAVKRAGLAPPLLLRPVGAHGGRGLVRVESSAELAGLVLAGDLYATAYRDYRSADGLYRKYRVIFVDRRAYPYHLAISPDWLVHYESAGMAGYAARRAEEAAFLADPGAVLGSPALTAITAIGQRLDLDYAGMDFGMLANETVLVFEANATMLAHKEESDGPFAYKNAAVAAIASAFKRMLGEAAAGR
jgi:tetratricopeptide (TPR) repeat protein